MTTPKSQESQKMLQETLEFFRSLFKKRLTGDIIDSNRIGKND